MQNEILSLLMNGLMAGLLLATIAYCLQLNRRIRLLQDSKSELAMIIREFDESTKRATQNINEIHAATMRISENMQHKIDKANYLANDLDMMIEKGSKLVGKPELAPARPARDSSAGGVGATRHIADIMPARSSEAFASHASPAVEDLGVGVARRPLRGRSRAEQDLMSLMGGQKPSTDSSR